jgi:hypothetical protein
MKRTPSVVSAALSDTPELDLELVILRARKMLGLSNFTMLTQACGHDTKRDL